MNFQRPPIWDHNRSLSKRGDANVFVLIETLRLVPLGLDSALAGEGSGPGSRVDLFLKASLIG